jgi:hypothetical protein
MDKNLKLRIRDLSVRAERHSQTGESSEYERLKVSSTTSPPYGGTPGIGSPSIGSPSASGKESGQTGQSRH